MYYFLEIFSKSNILNTFSKHINKYIEMKVWNINKKYKKKYEKYVIKKYNKEI